MQENAFLSYFLFIYDYINKTNYVPVLLQIFVMEFVREYLLRTSSLLLRMNLLINRKIKLKKSMIFISYFFLYLCVYVIIFI